MPRDVNTIPLFRIIPIKNLEGNLQNGLYCKNSIPENQNFVALGDTEIIAQRSRTPVKCYPEDVVNDYVPFYFSIRTPMLYNIITRRSGNYHLQEDIIYLCFKMTDLANENFKWCYTDGNAATKITKFYTDLNKIETNIDWHSIGTTDFRDANADGDEDRVRKKHSEFLVKEHVPPELIKAIIVLNAEKKNEVETILDRMKMNIVVKVDPNKKYYF